MTRVRFAIGMLMVLALAVFAQEAHNGHSGHAMASADQHLQMLTEKLDLTADQQAKAKPILQEMTDGAQKAMSDETLPREERTKKAHAVMMQADKKLRTFLTEEQKAKLDDMEQNQMHGDHAKPQQ